MEKSHIPRVLIAEDDYLVSEMVKGILQEMNYEVIGEASTGQEAVTLTRQLHPDVILMDIRMPDMDGIEATRQIAKQCATPVVMLTAYETPDLVVRAGEAGAGAFLVKPPSAPEIERTVTIAMARFDDLQQLQTLNAELQARNEELDAFAHTVAHDLRDLLGPIVGFAEALRDNLHVLPEEDVRRHLSTIAQSGRKISDVIESLLLLAGVRKVDVVLEPLAMEAIVDNALGRLSDAIAHRDAQIALPPRWPSAVGYAPWVEEIWVNYISNAIKYGGEPPRADLGATQADDGMILFWIRDNGQGIPLEQQASLFKPFTRLDRAHTAGYGLGLSIVRRIVERLGGEVGVESHLGTGSVFRFTLPAHEDPAG
jgi:signal transduction histidine kinase